MGLDSVYLLMAIEKKFGIDVPDREAETITTVGDFYRVVWPHISGRPYAPGQIKYSRLQMEQTINQVISDQIGIDLSDISPEKSLTDDLGID